MSDRSSRCARCHKNGKPCDGVLIAGSLERTSKSIQRTEDQIDEAEELLAAAQQKALEAHREATEALARLTRLRKHRRFLRDRGNDLLGRGVAELDDLARVTSDLPEFSLDDVLALESCASANAREVGAFGVIDCTAFDFAAATSPSGEAS